MSDTARAVDGWAETAGGLLTVTGRPLDDGFFLYLACVVAMRGGTLRIPRRVIVGMPRRATLRWSTDPETDDSVLELVGD